MNWPYDHELDDLDAPWDWPRMGWFSGMAGVLYEPCAFGCDLGSVIYSESALPMECPACAGAGVGGVHRC